MHNYQFKFMNQRFKNKYLNVQTFIIRIYIHKSSAQFKPFHICATWFKSLNLINQNVKEG